MKYKTHHFRVKDSNARNYLKTVSSKVNFVWNYCNETSQNAWRRKKWLSKFDMQNLCRGASKELSLNSACIQLVAHEHSNKRNQFKKCKLKWRSQKRTLGWIPFDTRCVKIAGDSILFGKKAFKLWKHREVEGKFKSGCFSENSRGQWFVCLVCEENPNKAPSTGQDVGVDLGFKAVATLSTGEVFEHPKSTRKYAEKLAKAQKAKKRKLVSRIHLKIANVRKDFNHKVSTKIVENFDRIFVGDVSSKAMIKKGKGFAKSATDASWGQLRTMLAYKANRLGRVFQPVKEAWSTVTCSNCFERSGPSGLSALGVRDWECSCCGTTHNRDVNAAKNILTFGVGLYSLNKREASTSRCEE